MTYFCLGDENSWCFFAAGACHILAHMFLLLNPNEDFDLIYTKPVNKQPGNHMYVSGGTWAFDFNRWSLEKDLLKVNETFAKDRYPNWNYERIVTKEGLPEYLKNSHHLRAPEYFPELPWKREYDYIHKLPSDAPESGVA